MRSSFFYIYEKIIILIIILIMLFVPTLYASVLQNNEYSDGQVYLSDIFAWPIPGYTTLSSTFGKRTSPTTGASSFHKGVDIPAPEGTKLYAIDDASIVFASWGAGGGYTITGECINYPEIRFSYCHVSPIFLVEKGDTVEKGQLIGKVGPKNVYGIENNQYKDSNGNPTNGATTGCHLHFAIKVNGTNVDPMSYYVQSESTDLNTVINNGEE